jgi:hypothetical protein
MHSPPFSLRYAAKDAALALELMFQFYFVLHLGVSSAELPVVSAELYRNASSRILPWSRGQSYTLPQTEEFFKSLDTIDPESYPNARM